VSIWDWVHQFADEAEENGDEDRLHLHELHQRAQSFMEGDPDRALAILAEARVVAEKLGENWWVLFLDHWQLQELIHEKRDFRDVLPIAVRATLEARKPENSGLPQRVCLHEDLIYGYLFIDPLGYADVISEALDYMQDEVAEDVECRYCIQGCRTEFALACGELDKARESVRVSLAMADDDSNIRNAEHHGRAAWCDLCQISWLSGDHETLEEAAREGEVLARRTENHLGLAEILAWQALLARQEGDDDMARRRMRQAQQRTGRVKSIPSDTFFNILAVFHEKGGDLEEAWQVREQELSVVGGKGRLYDEFLCRLQRLRLLVRMGQPHEPELALVREAAEKLRDPIPHLDQIERTLEGENVEEWGQSCQ
jgi:hypothetical protein